MPLTSSTAITLTCDCCGYQTININDTLQLVLSTVIDSGGPLGSTIIATVTFCRANHCADHVQPITQYMVQETATLHANKAAAAGVAVSTFLHPGLEITLADDTGTVFANATSPM